jgi:FkbH-like protein
MPDTPQKGIDLKVAVLSSYTVQTIEKQLIENLKTLGFRATIRLGGFDQFNQELVDKGSWLREFSPDVIVIALSHQTFFPDLVYSVIDGKGIQARCFDKIALLLQSIEQYELKTNFIVTSLDFPTYSPCGLLDFQREGGLHSIIESCNKMLADYSRSNTKVTILDFDRVVRIVGQERMGDPKLFYFGKMLLGTHAGELFAREIATYINALYGRIRKCIVVDLDNTIWSGVIGEDGAEAIVVGDSPLGSIYRDIQRVLLNYRKAGILLAIASKNNIDDVMPVFSVRKSDMVLAKEDFIAMRISWQPKSQSILEIAQELNLGLDSFVFLDDNPAERLEVAERLPEVAVVDFPKDPAQLPGILAELLYLKPLRLTAEDRTRHEMYVQDLGRTELQKTEGISDYLMKLGTNITVAVNDSSNIERITQLINKTNQFNLRTQRYTLEEVRSMTTSGDHVVTSVTVKDKFGELGLTGVIILKKTAPARYFIDTFLLSCRVLSREIEKQFFTETLKVVKGANLEAEYRETKKNSMVKGFYESLGFSLISEADGVKHYRREKGNIPADIPSITVVRP